ncbi:MAG: DUF3311 domain-containing protein [Gemmatimonadaceae bacterium]
MNMQQDLRTQRNRGWRRATPLLLIIPYIGTLWVSSYTSIAPEVWGIPFFYWYQFLWIGIGATITIVVYLTDESARRNGHADIGDRAERREQRRER